MRFGASPASAQRRLTALRQTAARFRARDLVKVLGGVVAVLFCLQLAYVVIANALLRSQVIQRSIASAQGFALEFSQAYTLLPGRVHLRDLSLRVEDYNVQFEVAIGQASLDIALSELLFKKFHVTRLDARGTRFRMRHKLISVGDDAERVAAYPPIEGFADPPYFVGVRPASLGESDEYDLWRVRIEHVTAAVTELWVMEYRYQGAGLARGSFVVHPSRWVQVEPASLRLDGGRLTLGKHLVAGQVQGKITCDIPDMHVQERDGAAVLKDISSRVRLELRGGHFDFLQAYLARLGSARYGGNAEFLLDLNVVRGVVGPGSRVDARGAPLRVHHELADLSGNVMLSARRETEPAIELALSAPHMVASRKSTAPSPYVEGLAGSLTVQGVDLSEGLSLGAAKLAVRRVHAASLAWFAPRGTTLAGSADASFELSRSAERVLAGRAGLKILRARAASGDFALAGDVDSDVGFTQRDENAAVELQTLSVQLSAATLQSAAKRSKQFDVLVEGANLRLEPDAEASAAGVLRVRVSDAEALLPLVMGAPLTGITGVALNLKQLDAQTSVLVSGQGVNVKLIDARSGNLRARGYFSKQASQPRGAFLLSSGPINVGVTLSHGETEVSPFVGDGWLATTWPRISQTAPGPG
jgi:hypothetical protein